MTLDIIKAISDYARSYKMEFMSGFASQMTESKLTFPLIWLEPLTLCDRTGRKDASAKFKVKLHIMQLDQNFPKKPLEQAWEEMTIIAINLFDVLEDNPNFIATKNLICSPTTSRMTNYGELAVTVTFEIETLLCN